MGLKIGKIAYDSFVGAEESFTDICHFFTFVWRLTTIVCYLFWKTMKLTGSGSGFYQK